MGSQHATRGPVVPSKTTQQWLHDSTNTASTSRGKACGYLAEGDSCIYGSRYKFSHHPEDIAAFKAKTARKGKGWAIGGGSGFAIASSEDKGEAVIPETELGTTNPELQASAIKQERLRGRSSELASLEARLIEARRRGFQGKPGKEG